MAAEFKIADIFAELTIRKGKFASAMKSVKKDLAGIDRAIKNTAKRAERESAKAAAKAQRASERAAATIIKTTVNAQRVAARATEKAARDSKKIISQAAVKAAQDSKKAAERAARSIKRATEKIARAANQAARETKRAADKAARDAERASRRIARAAAQASRRAAREAEKAARRVRVAINKMVAEARMALRRLSVTARRAFLALSLGIGLTVRSFGNFELAMARVKIITKASTEEFHRLKEAARGAAVRTVFTAVEAARAMEKLAVANLNVNEIIKALPTSLNLANIAQIGTAEGALAATRIMGAMGLTAAQLEDTIDALTKAFTSSKLTLIDLSESFKFVGPLAQSFGVDVNTITAALKGLAEKGLFGEIAGTGLRRVLSGLGGSTTAARKFLAEFGIEVEAVGGRMKDLFDIVADTNEALKSLSAVARSAKINEAFGVRAGPTFIALLETGADSLKRWRKEVKTATGFANEFSSAMLDTVVQSLKIFISKATELAIVVGEQIAPAIRNLAQFFGDLAISVSVMNTNVIKSIAKWLLWATAVSAALVIIPPLILVIHSLRRSMIGLAIAQGVLAGPKGILALIAALATMFALFKVSGALLDSFFDSTISKQERLTRAVENTNKKLERQRRLRFLDIAQRIPSTRLAANLTQLGELSGIAKADVRALTPPRGLSQSPQRTQRLADARARLADLQRRAEVIRTEIARRGEFSSKRRQLAFTAFIESMEEATRKINETAGVFLVDVFGKPKRPGQKVKDALDFVANKMREFGNEVRDRKEKLKAAAQERGRDIVDRIQEKLDAAAQAAFQFTGIEELSRKVQTAAGGGAADPLKVSAEKLRELARAAIKEQKLDKKRNDLLNDIAGKMLGVVVKP